MACERLNEQPHCLGDEKTGISNLRFQISEIVAHRRFYDRAFFPDFAPVKDSTTLVMVAASLPVVSATLMVKLLAPPAPFPAATFRAAFFGAAFRSGRAFFRSTLLCAAAFGSGENSPGCACAHALRSAFG
jgi:hypothetical protein